MDQLKNSHCPAMKTVLFFCWLTAAVLKGTAATFGTFQTPVGSWDVEFFDEDKPITVSNFLKYASSGRYQNQFIHRWDDAFVIQGGGWRVDTSGPSWQIARVQSYGNITNEYSAGRPYSNTYGTIAMARQSGNTNSASSEWFFNLGNNSLLDNVDGGFTVFGRLTAGADILNKFIPPPPTQGIYLDANIFPELPVLSTNLQFSDLIYVNLLLRREVNLRLTSAQAGPRIAWTSVANLTNSLEYTTNPASNLWNTVTNFLGTGSAAEVTDIFADPRRVYRVRLLY
jgi:cyclophilin family peptidyl-prolyl cis-trans isomerase